MIKHTQTPSVNFRELDDEILLNRAKEWLEAILGDRLDDQVLAEALANGDILHRVSKLLKEQLQDFGEDITTPKLPFWETDIEGKKSGKYLPYSNVDSFLKVCKRLRLPDIDLFSPPDVVEKKDIRKVCLCIRALSKKARANRMRIPDFDNVSGTMVALQNGNNFSIQDASSTPESELKNETCSRKSSSINSAESTASSIPLETQMFQEGSNRESLNSQANFSLDQKTSINDLTSQQDPDNLESTCFPVSRRTYESGSSESTNAQQFCNSTMKKLERNLNDGHINGEARKGGKIGLWVAIVAGAATLIGIVLTRRLREPEIYEVKEGDTLSEIGRKTGKNDWQKLVEINPGIKDPNLIYPSDRLRLRG